MATIVSNAGAAGNFSAGSSWIGGVAPTAADSAQVPLATTSITIDAGSVCRGLDFTTFTGTVTHNAGATLTIGDGTAALSNIALKLVSGMTYNLGNASTSAISFISTSGTAQTIDFGTKTVGNITINGAGSSYTLVQSFTSGGAAAWTYTAGTTLNTSTNSVVITCTQAAPTFAGGGKSYFGVTLSALTGTGVITGANTFTTLTLTSAGNAGSVTFSANQTITTFAPTGGSTSNRLGVYSNTIGTVRTLTVTNTPSTANNTDWQDITISGVTLSGTSVGDAGGNSGITFTGAVTRYWVATSGGNWNATSSWSATDGGAFGASVPLAQDTAIINNNSITSGGRTILAISGVAWLGKDLTFTGVLNSPTFTVAGNGITGSLTLASGVTMSGGFGLTFHNRSNATLTSAGATITAVLGTRCTGSTLTLGDAFVSTAGLTVGTGTFDTGNFNYTADGIAVTSIFLSVATSPIATFGSSTLTLTGTGTQFNTFGTFTINAGTSLIKMTNTTNTAITFAGGGKTYYNVYFNRGASTAANTITGSNTFNDFKDDGTAAHSLLITDGTTQTFTTWSVSGTSGNLITINGTSTATHVLQKVTGGTNFAAVSADYLNIQHSIAKPGAIWYAGVNSTNNQATSTAGSGWIFTAPTSNGNSNGFFMFMDEMNTG